MLSVDAARAAILDGVRPTPAETVAIEAARGRVLAEPVVATRAQPPFATSSMDGYAFRIGRTRYRVVGTARAGEAHVGALAPDAAIRVFTGAPLPDGIDGILPQERARRDGDALIVDEAPIPGRFLRRAGLDFPAGAAVLPAGRRLDPRAIGLAAAANAAVLSVRRRPRVGLIATGDELSPVGVATGPDGIVASSIHAVAALVDAAGGEAVSFGIAPDDVAALGRAVDRAIDSDLDVLLTLGGASVGDHDLVKPVLAAKGLDLAFWTIAMRPGKPLMFGRLGPLSVVGLPGNPVSSYVCAKLFVEPLIDALLGRPPGPAFERATLGADLAANDAREDYLRATLAPSDGLPVATAARVQDSSMQAVLAGADALIRRAAHAPAARAGEVVDIIRL